MKGIFDFKCNTKIWALRDWASIVKIHNDGYLISQIDTILCKKTFEPFNRIELRWIATWLISWLLCLQSIAQSLDELRAMAQSGQCHQVITLCDSLEDSSMLRQDQSLLADYWNVKANCLRQLGEPIFAIELHEKILIIRRRYFGEGSLEVANTYQNLGNCYLQINRADEAMPLLKKR